MSMPHSPPLTENFPHRPIPLRQRPTDHQSCPSDLSSLWYCELRHGPAWWMGSGVLCRPCTGLWNSPFLLDWKSSMTRNVIIIINLIYIAQFDTNSILTALYIVITYIQMQYVHVSTYMKQSYSYTYTCLHINTYTITCANIYLPTY